MSPAAIRRNSLAFATTAALLLVVQSPVPACSIPLFRYALEKWQPTKYEVTIVHRGRLSAEETAQLNRLGISNANLTVKHVDLAADADAHWEKVVGKRTLPCVVAKAVGENGLPPAWMGALNTRKIDSLFRSPARTEIAKRLLVGDSVVFVMLDGADAAENEQIEAMLKKELDHLAKEIKLPEPSDVGPQIESAIPLRVAFSILRIARNDSAESGFRQNLLNGDPKLTEVRGPIVCPIFGRGRMLDAFHGEDLNREMIAKAADFLCRTCTCQEKELSPGRDLLFDMDWESSVFAKRVAHASNANDLGDTMTITAPRRRVGWLIWDGWTSQPAVRRALWGLFALAIVAVLASGWWVVRVSKRRSNTPIGP